jgi:hypothetical protein
MCKLFILTALAIAGVQIKSLNAAVIFDSLPGGIGNDAVDFNNFPAQSFDVGDNSFVLTSVVMGMQDNEVSEGGGFQLFLYDATGLGNSPGNVIAALNGNSDPDFGQATYTPSSPITLAAHTSYWISAQVPGLNPFPGSPFSIYFWMFSPGQSGITTGTSSLWAYDDGFVRPGDLYGQGFTLAMQVNGNAIVPETSITGLASASLGLLLFGTSVTRKYYRRV